MKGTMILTNEQKRKIGEYVKYLEDKYGGVMEFKTTTWGTIQIFSDKEYLVRGFTIEEIDTVLLKERMEVLK